MYKAQLTILFCLTFFIKSFSQERDFNEQVIGWLTFNIDDPFMTQAGIRYLPELRSNKTFNDNLKLKTI